MDLEPDEHSSDVGTQHHSREGSGADTNQRERGRTRHGRCSGERSSESRTKSGKAQEAGEQERPQES